MGPRVVLCWAALALAACGGTAPPAGPAIVVESAWARPTTAGADDPAHAPDAPGVLYLELRNDGTEGDRLLGVRTPAAADPELHVTRAVDGVVTMDAVPGVDVPAGGRVAMAPGGTHVMLFELARHLRPGDRFEVVLDFERSGAVTVEALVREP